MLEATQLLTMITNNADLLAYSKCVLDTTGFLVGTKTPLPEVYQQAVQLACLVEEGM